MERPMERPSYIHEHRRHSESRCERSGTVHEHRRHDESRVERSSNFMGVKSHRISVMSSSYSARSKYQEFSNFAEATFWTMKGRSDLITYYHEEVPIEELPQYIVSTRSFSLACNPNLRRLMNVIILVNAVQMGVSTDRTEKQWETLWTVCDNFFTVAFALEMGLHLVAFRRFYFFDYWNWLDFFVANVAVINTWILPLTITGGSKAFGSLRIVRLLRLLRIFKMIRAFPELAVLTSAMMGSMRALFWIVVLLLMVLYAAAITCVEVIGREERLYPGFSKNQSSIDHKQVALFNPYTFFGTVTRATLSLFNLVLLDEWGPIIRPVFEKQRFMVLFFMVIVVICAFGVLNLVFGVVVERTTRAMDQFRQREEEMWKYSQLTQIQELADIFFEIDSDGDQQISWNEFISSSKTNKNFRDILTSMNLPLGFSFTELFHMLDRDADQLLSKDELVGGMIRLLHCDPFQRDCMHFSSMGKLRRLMASVQSELMTSIMQVKSDMEAEIHAATDTILAEFRHKCDRSHAGTCQANSGQLDSSVAELSHGSAPGFVWEPVHPVTVTNSPPRALHPSSNVVQCETQDIPASTVSARCQFDLRRDIRELREEMIQSFHENRYESALLCNRLQQHVDRASKLVSSLATEIPRRGLKHQCAQVAPPIGVDTPDAWSSVLNDFRVIAADLRVVLTSVPRVTSRPTSLMPSEPKARVNDPSGCLNRFGCSYSDCKPSSMADSCASNDAMADFGPMSRLRETYRINPIVVSNYWKASDKEGKIRTSEDVTTTWQHFIVQWISRTDAQKMNFDVVGDVEAAKAMKKAIEVDFQHVANITAAAMDGFTSFPMSEDYFSEVASEITHEVLVKSPSCKNIQRVSARYVHVTSPFKLSAT